MTPAAGRGGNPPSREHPISAGSAGGRHRGGRLRTGQVTPPRGGSASSARPARLPPLPPVRGTASAFPEPCRPGGRRRGLALPGAARTWRQSPQLQHVRGCGLRGGEEAARRRGGAPGRPWPGEAARPTRAPPPPGVTCRGSAPRPAERVSAPSSCPRPLRARSQVPALGVLTPLVSPSGCRQLGKTCRGVRAF